MMPDRSSSVVSYAAGASLAAVALIYVFGPNFTIDGDGTGNSSRSKKTIVGLRNQANDCFINSVLQALAGLGDLRVYLIRETHRRRIEDPAVYSNLVQPKGIELAQWKLQGLQDGLVTQGLKDMLDALNERPIARKSISPFQFVRVLEVAFKQRISRQQQDAQEFLQIVAERLKDEYHAGQRARQHARRHGLTPVPTPVSAPVSAVNGVAQTNGHDAPTNGTSLSEKTADALKNGVAETLEPEEFIPLEIEDRFPMEGKYESHLECQTCKYQTKPREETFCTLTLAVPQVTSTTLSSCFDGIFKTELIDDFKCEMCRLLQAEANLEHEMTRSTSESFKKQARQNLQKLKFAIQTDPENPPEDVDLGDIRYAPKRKIAKTTRMTVFPRILAVHLSRSIYGAGQMTQKNSAKVSFPEQLPLGSLADQHKYKLLGVVSHRGGHNSGHYEAFRRQNVPIAYHNANTFAKSEIYSKTPTPVSTPELPAHRMVSPAVSTPDLLSPSSGNSTASIDSLPPPPRSVPSGMGSPLSTGRHDTEASSLRSAAASTRSALARITSSKEGSFTPKKTHQPSAALRHKKRKTVSDRWWRVSDEKVREAKTGEVLGMQREVYLLFYELEREI